MEVNIAYEVNFDGIVGPSHNYAGLSFGNLASQKHERSVSRPREAALQGLAKMKYLADLGLKQAVLPPQERPDLQMLRRLGFGGSDADVLANVAKEDPRLLAAAYSASSMWAANAATVSPSADSADGRLHFTPANLVTQFHRSIETPATAAILKAIFPDESAFAHHPPLPATPYFSDEGAANHTRLCEHYGSPGIELFVYGRDASNPAHNPAVFPARQTRQASVAIGRVHLLDPRYTTFTQQNPNAIDAGVFHNDVVSVGNGNVLLYHASAYAKPTAVMEDIRQQFAGRSSVPLHLIEISEEQVPLQDAITTYLFNSQLVTLPEGGMSLIAPVECRENQGVERAIQQIIAAENPIQSVHYLDVRQSMKNGGGPACLQLRVVLTDRELSLVHPGVFLTDLLYGKLVAWVSRHYRETLRPEDLADPALANECRSALDELSGILGLKEIYAFQN
jgi:succinylarginine dihydrolase